MFIPIEKLKKILYEIQEGRCGLCKIKKPIELLDKHEHPTRGATGGKQSLIQYDPLCCVLLCRKCHTKVHTDLSAQSRIDDNIDEKKDRLYITMSINDIVKNTMIVLKETGNI